MPAGRPSRQQTDATTPFAKLLIDYMWDRSRTEGRVWTVGTLATKLGKGRGTVSQWINHGRIPPLDELFAVLAKLDIPLERLAEAYADAGVPMPPMLADATTPPQRPRPYVKPAPPADEWDFLVTQTRAALEEEGLPEETIQHAITRIRDRQRGDERTMERHYIAEHTDTSAGEVSRSSRRRRMPLSGK